MKRLIIPVTYLVVLMGCSNNSADKAEPFLLQACKSFDELSFTSDYDRRRQLLGEAQLSFRNAAFVSSEVRFEVLAEYAGGELDSSGNLYESYFEKIKKFCSEQLSKETE